MLERDYGWESMLVEPLPWAFIQAKWRRPKAHVIEGAVDPTYAHKSRTLEFISAGQLGTIGDYRDNDRHAATRAQRRSIRVKTINLQTEIARQFPGRVIDFMSIDVEGPEVDIITGFDFDAIDVRSIAVEVNDRAGDGSRIAAFLEANGFRQPFSRRVTRNDMWFTRNDYDVPASR